MTVQETIYLAVCPSCTPVLPLPFGDEEERARWVAAHEQGTGHRVRLLREDRIRTEGT